MRRFCLAWLIGGLLVGVNTTADLAGRAPTPVAQEAPRFRSSTELVVQAVTVRDREGRPIRGLTARDFAITEDGRPQTISFVDYQEIDATPLSPDPRARADALPFLLEAPASVPAVTRETFAVPASADAIYRGRRLLVFYFDLSSLAIFERARAFEGAGSFLETQMTAADTIAMLTWDGQTLQLRAPFTDDRAILGRALAELQAEADDPSAANATSGRGAFGDEGGSFGLFTTDRRLSALQSAATGLGAIPQTKTLIYFGSGLAHAGLENLAQLRATVNAAVRAGVTLNPIDARGLQATPPMGDASQPSTGGVGMFSGATSQRMNLSADRARDLLHALANDTGGRTIFDTNDLARGVADVARAVTGYYLLGYYPTNTAADGRYRRIKVALTSELAATLSHRQGYFASKDYRRFNAVEKEQQLAQALAFDDPLTEIPMAAEINYFRIGAAEYFVPISVRLPGDLGRARSDGSLRADLDFIGEIKDEHGTTMRNMRDRAEFSMGRDSATGHIAPLQYEAGFSLLPGNYVVKLLARDATTGRIGTYLASFSIPRPVVVQGQLEISSVVLTQQRVMAGDALFTVRQKVPGRAAHPLFDGEQQVVPSVTRAFSRQRPLFVFVEAYPPAGTAPVALAAFVTFIRDGKSVFETEPVGVTVAGTTSIRAVPVRLTVPLSGIDPGEYECQVTVLDPAGTRAAFWRGQVAIGD